MKIAVLIARILLGLIFVFFGLNAFFNFLHAPMPAGVAGQFIGALYTSHFYVVLFAFQIIGGLLLLSGRFIPLALVILAPILVNILIFHLTMAAGHPAGAASAQCCGSLSSPGIAIPSPAILNPNG